MSTQPIEAQTVSQQNAPQPKKHPRLWTSALSFIPLANTWNYYNAAKKAKKIQSTLPEGGMGVQNEIQLGLKRQLQAYQLHLIGEMVGAGGFIAIVCLYETGMREPLFLEAVSKLGLDKAQDSSIVALVFLGWALTVVSGKVFELVNRVYSASKTPPLSIPVKDGEKEPKVLEDVRKLRKSFAQRVLRETVATVVGGEVGTSISLRGYFNQTAVVAPEKASTIEETRLIPKSQN
ncbi:MAG: hypothetical protein QM752_03840 [Gammaproteobacteria bacterium]